MDHDVRDGAAAATEIRLAAQGLADGDLDGLCQRILEQQQSLTALDLRDNQLTDDGCAALAASIVVVPSLRLVDLSGNGITNAGRLTIFRALANARRRCNVLLRGEGVRDILLAVKPRAEDGSPRARSPPRVEPGEPAEPAEPEPAPAPRPSPRDDAPSPQSRESASPSRLAEHAIAEAERALARSGDPRASPFSQSYSQPEPARASPSRRSPTRLPTERKPESPVATEVRTRPSAAADEIRLEGLGLTAVPPRLGEDRPGRVRPRKVDLSDNKLSSLAGLPQSVVQLRAANNVLRDWEGLQTLPRCGAHLVTDPLPPS